MLMITRVPAPGALSMRSSPPSACARLPMLASPTSAGWSASPAPDGLVLQPLDHAEDEAGEGVGEQEH
jgi:hypothetical protein